MVMKCGYFCCDQLAAMPGKTDEEMKTQLRYTDR